jgi:hypothetical protein
MKSLHLVALLGLFACGQAVDAPSDDDAQPDPDPATSAELGNQTETRSTRPSTPRPSTPRPLPQETVPQWRTCETDDDCELRGSVCEPLDVGGLVSVCRRERALPGEACTGDNGCELGLTCDAAASTCRPFDLRGGETNDRKPLSCEPDGSTVDAHCESVD